MITPLTDGFCANPPDKGAKDTQNLIMGVWRVPPRFISTPDPSDKNGTRKPLPGFQSKHLLVPDSAPTSPPPDLREEAESADLFQDGESGTIVDCEPVVGPDNVVIDANVTYRFRSPASSETSSEIRFITEFTTWEGYPVVLHVSPSSTHEGKFFVVVANIRLVNAGGWNLKEAAGEPVPTASPEG